VPQTKKGKKPVDNQKTNGLVPDARNFCFNIHRKGCFELLALLLSVVVIAHKHSISQGSQLAIPCWKQANL
jgi:hypothetical protein